MELRITTAQYRLAEFPDYANYFIIKVGNDRVAYGGAKWNTPRGAMIDGMKFVAEHPDLLDKYDNQGAKI